VQQRNASGESTPHLSGATRRHGRLGPTMPGMEDDPVDVAIFALLLGVTLLVLARVLTIVATSSGTGLGPSLLVGEGSWANLPVTAVLLGVTLLAFGRVARASASIKESRRAIVDQERVPGRVPVVLASPLGLRRSRLAIGVAGALAGLVAISVLAATIYQWKQLHIQPSSQRPDVSFTLGLVLGGLSVFVPAVACAAIAGQAWTRGTEALSSAGW